MRVSTTETASTLNYRALRKLWSSTIKKKTIVFRTIKLKFICILGTKTEIGKFIWKKF